MSGSRVARVPTASASRYLQQLCKHWSHRFAVEFTAERGTVPLPTGRLELAALPGALEVRLAPEPGTDVARMQQVIAEHLDRFAFREAPLRFDWRDGDRAGS